MNHTNRSMNKVTRVLSRAELVDLIDYLERLARIYATLGHPEDELAVMSMVQRLKGPKVGGS